MASPSRRSRHPLIERLFREGFRFGFFQAVRLLEAGARRDARSARFAARAPTGEDAEPGTEVVRFRAMQSLAFPASEIADLRPDEPDPDNPRPAGPPVMRVGFMGLTGPSGVLPYHYTETVVRSVRARTIALRDFFDLFNHRTISLFYKAWQKYRLPIAYEREPDATDPISQAMFALLGFGTGSLRGRLALHDQALLHYGGYFAHSPRSAVGLERLLSDAFDQPVEVEQFKGHWIILGAAERSRMPGPDVPDGLYHQLGVNAVIGARVWDVQGSFRLRLGPLTYREFLRFMPSGDDLRRMAQLTQLYVGPDLAFDVQLTLRKEDAPDLLMSEDPLVGPRLGWNTWLKVGEFQRDLDDSVFQVSGLDS